MCLKVRCGSREGLACLGERGGGKTATLWLSDGCHPTERSWMEVGHGASSSGPRSKRRLFIASAPARGLLPDCAFDPLAGPTGWRILNL
ncbi:unnamed protein product [Spirodela intermedia]|uniref:Uncharacterized protein n=1 Tax=Spirodela intermedia TaxID=51605 RepID=A0A7I8JXT0_SPIIN|nr:unnamed protein product [Spirodela intermedia]